MCSPHVVAPESQTNHPVEEVEQLAELQSDQKLQLRYGQLTFLKFTEEVLLVKKDYPEVAVEYLPTLSHFPTKYPGPYLGGRVNGALAQGSSF